MFPISICIIGKNEEKHLPQFLESIKRAIASAPIEIVYVDTGSTDKSLEIARKYTSAIYHFDWIGDFSAARNFSLSCATNDWVLVLDCDEYVLNLDLNSFYEMAEQYPAGVGMLTRKNHFAMNETDSIYTDEVERFFNRKLFHYEAIIHEQVCSLNGTPFDRVAIELIVDHCGYNGTKEEMERKVQRNNELLLKMLEEHPNDPYLYFQIGQSYNSIHDDAMAASYYSKGLEFDLDPNLEYVQMMVIAYGYNLLHLERYQEALQYQNIYTEFATSADFVCLMGLIYLRNGMVVQAMKEFLYATTFHTSKTEGANSFIPTYNMGCINEVLGETETAISLYKKCGNFQPALNRLKELCP